MQAFVRQAMDGSFEADLFALDGIIPPKDPPRVRGQPSAYVAARELVLAFSNGVEHADLWAVAIPPALLALLEELRRQARTPPPPPPSAQRPGSASHLAIDVDREEDELGGTAPLGSAGQASTATAPGAHDGGLEYGEIAADIAADNMAAHIAAMPAGREHGHASSSGSASRDPAVQPALRPGTRPPSRLDEQSWDAYVYQTSRANTFYGAWGFDGTPALAHLFFNCEAQKAKPIPLAAGRPTKEDAAMRRYEGLMRYGEGARISYALREFYLQQTAALDIEMRAMLASVRAVYTTGECRATMLRRLELEPAHRLAQLVLLAAAPEQHPALLTFASQGATIGGTLPVPSELDDMEVAEGGGEEGVAEGGGEEGGE
eukprot:jgi/Chrpa1/19762/Chrysochromulina_OHIO_Genome00024780-RA